MHRFFAGFLGFVRFLGHFGSKIGDFWRVADGLKDRRIEEIDHRRGESEARGDLFQQRRLR